MLNQRANLLAFDPWDSSVYPFVVSPLEPLPEDLQADLIYRWDKIMSLVNDPFQLANPKSPAEMS